MYFNISISKDQTNTKDQREINKEAFAELEKLKILRTVEFETLKTNILTKKQLSYQEALQMLQLLRESGISSGIMCYSGKDRTGVIVANLARIITEKALNNSSSTMGSINARSLAVSVSDYNAVNPYENDTSVDSTTAILDQNSTTQQEIYTPTKITFLKLGPNVQDSRLKKCQQILHVAVGYLKGTNIAD